MKRLILMMSLLWTWDYTIHAEVSSQFEGEWELKEIVSVPEGEIEPSNSEIRYPVWLDIKFTVDGIKVNYRDQFGVAAVFSAAFLINEGKDLIMVGSGTTKEADSFAPVHHVKVIDGLMIGAVQTRVRLFEWRAVKRRIDTKP